MHLIFHNVNDAFKGLVELFDTQGFSGKHCEIIRWPSRNGDVLMIDGPVTLTYTHPKERVLFNRSRDANPFFHLYEALWMLAGRNDVTSVAYYAKQMAEYSDDGKTLNGAYGYRWRYARPHGLKDHPTKYATVVPTAVDQLDLLVAHLTADPTSRRAVLQMWNVEDDLLKVGLGTEPADAQITSKDVCCNLSVMFSLRPTDPILDAEHVKTEGSVATMRKPKPYALDMTVTNRSNDLVWGLLGANYVHFTTLQEYMAARLGCEVGKYHHFTNNLHVYTWNWKPKEWLADATGYGSNAYVTGKGNQFGSRSLTLVPLVQNPAVFEEELPRFVEWYGQSRWPTIKYWKEPFLNDVAQPLLTAHDAYKNRETIALRYLENCRADDWRFAAEGWLRRRLDKKVPTEGE